VKQEGGEKGSSTEYDHPPYYSSENRRIDFCTRFTNMEETGCQGLNENGVPISQSCPKPELHIAAEEKLPAKVIGQIKKRIRHKIGRRYASPFVKRVFSSKGFQSRRRKSECHHHGGENKKGLQAQSPVAEPDTIKGERFMEDEFDHHSW
jgi:hypothetical protein